jgi:hypothetical protein
VDLESDLWACLTTDDGRERLAALDDDELPQLAGDLLQRDPYGTVGLLRAAFSIVGSPARPVAAVEHSLWCAVREARWLRGRLRHEDVGEALQVEGCEHLQACMGHPTVLISPMTLGTHDALAIVRTLHARHGRGAPLACYGEGMESLVSLRPELSRLFVGAAMAGMRRALDTLSSGGIFVTYPDFVYAGHVALPGRLFGTPRPLSAGFAGLCARPGTRLLPCLMTRRGSRLQVRFYPAVVYADPAGLPAGAPGRNVARRVVARVTSGILEALIRERPEQWRLLATLTHEAPELQTAPA